MDDDYCSLFPFSNHGVDLLGILTPFSGGNICVFQRLYLRLSVEHEH